MADGRVGRAETRQRENPPRRQSGNYCPLGISRNRGLLSPPCNCPLLRTYVPTHVQRFFFFSLSHARAPPFERFSLVNRANRKDLSIFSPFSSILAVEREHRVVIFNSIQFVVVYCLSAVHNTTIRVRCNVNSMLAGAKLPPVPRELQGPLIY